VYKIYDFETPYPIPLPTPFLCNFGDEILIYRGFTQLQPTEVQVLAWATAHNGIAELVSWSYAGPGLYVYPDQTKSDVDMVYHNLFPCIDFSADFIFHYTGTIPAKIDDSQIFPILYDINYPDSEELAALWGIHQANPSAGLGMWVEAYRIEPIKDTSGAIIGWGPLGEPVDVGYQLHNCNYVYVKLVIHLPQNNDWQGLHGAFGGKIGVIQWNDACGPVTPGPG